MIHFIVIYLSLIQLPGDHCKVFYYQFIITKSLSVLANQIVLCLMGWVITSKSINYYKNCNIYNKIKLASGKAFTWLDDHYKQLHLK